VLFSDDLPRTAAFYTGLGFAETFRVPVEGDPIHVDLVLDGYRIGIATAESTRDDHGLSPLSSGQRAAVVLWTDDVPAAYDALTAAGTAGLSPPHPWLDRLLSPGWPTRTVIRCSSCSITEAPCHSSRPVGIGDDMGLIAGPH
jgi:glyoxylase I family protein